MKAVLEIFTNYILLCAAAGWVLAQFLKFIINLVFQKKIDFTQFVSSGGMPSSHSATVCAMTTAVGFIHGTTSTEFAISFILSFIVMYDASGVRHEAGEQAKIINRIVNDLSEGKHVYFNKELKELIGHTKLEVLAGAALGIAVSVIAYYAFYLS